MLDDLNRTSHPPEAAGSSSTGSSTAPSRGSWSTSRRARRPSRGPSCSPQDGASSARERVFTLITDQRDPEVDDDKGIRKFSANEGALLPSSTPSRRPGDRRDRRHARHQGRQGPGDHDVAGRLQGSVDEGSRRAGLVPAAAAARVHARRRAGRPVPRRGEHPLLPRCLLPGRHHHQHGVGQVSRPQAGPYTKPDPSLNVNHTVRVAPMLMDAEVLARRAASTTCGTPSPARTRTGWHSTSPCSNGVTDSSAFPASRPVPIVSQSTSSSSAGAPCTARGPSAVTHVAPGHRRAGSVDRSEGRTSDRPKTPSTTPARDGARSSPDQATTSPAGPSRPPPTPRRSRSGGTDTTTTALASHWSHVRFWVLDVDDFDSFRRPRAALRDAATRAPASRPGGSTSCSAGRPTARHPQRRRAPAGPRPRRPGDGGQIVAPPSIHPTATPTSGTPVWATTSPRRRSGCWSSSAPNRRPRPPERTVAASTDRPGDRWAASTTWGELLERDGWQLHHVDRDGEHHWTRPGKERWTGRPATTGLRALMSSRCSRPPCGPPA